MYKLIALSFLLITQSYGYSIVSAINDYRSIKESYQQESAPQQKRSGKVEVPVELSKYINKNKCDQVIDQQVFHICFDYKQKLPKMVGYKLDGNKVNSTNVKERAKFYSEDSLPNQYRLKSADYKKTGYDRGHMAPDASFDSSEDSLVKTYTMANIAPQSPHLNQKTWTKVEKHERDMAERYGEVTILNIVHFPENKVIIGQKNNLSVPIAFTKVLFNAKEKFQECYFYKNEMPLLDQLGNQVMNEKGIGSLIETIDIDNDKLTDHRINCINVKELK